MHKKRIQNVEDESAIAEDTGFIVQDCGYDIAGFITSGDRAVKVVAKLKPDLVINGIELKTFQGVN